MSYIQVEFLGKLRGLKFNQAALVEVQLKNGNNTTNAVQYYYAVIWGGLIGNCIVKCEEPDFTYEQVCDAVDKLDVEVAAAIADCYKSTLPPAEPKKKVIKKLTPKSTKPNALK